MRKFDNNPNVKHFRSADRLFRVDDAWYAETREGDIGPFPTQQEANLRLRQYIAEQESLYQAQQKMKKLRDEKKVVDTGIWDTQIGVD